MAYRKEQEPTEKAGIIGIGDRRFTHPAFGQIGASRVTGGTTLYGSDFVHQNFVTISIRRSELNRGLSHDWHFGTDELIEVHLSEAQWATFVSSMNVGMGVPCTISHINHEPMPSIPLRQQTDEFKKELQEDLTSLGELVMGTIKDVEGELGAGLSIKKKTSILGKLRKLHQQVTSNIPFVTKSLEKHMETTVEKAKVEVNAYIQSHITRAGIDALKSQKDSPLMLESGGVKDEFE
jgi:hypothetical protein